MPVFANKQAMREYLRSMFTTCCMCTARLSGAQHASHCPRTQSRALAHAPADAHGSTSDMAAAVVHADACTANDASADAPTARAAHGTAHDEPSSAPANERARSTRTRKLPWKLRDA